MFWDGICFDFTGLNYIEPWPDTQQVLRLYTVVIAGQVGVVMRCIWELKLIYNSTIDFSSDVRLSACLVLLEVGAISNYIKGYCERSAHSSR